MFHVKEKQIETPTLSSDHDGGLSRQHPGARFSVQSRLTAFAGLVKRKSAIVLNLRKASNLKHSPCCSCMAHFVFTCQRHDMLLLSERKSNHNNSA